MTEAALEIQETDLQFFEHNNQLSVTVTIQQASQIMGIFWDALRLIYLISQGAQLTLRYTVRRKKPGEWDHYADGEHFSIHPCVAIIELCEGEFMRAPAPETALVSYMEIVRQNIDNARGRNV